MQGRNSDGTNVMEIWQMILNFDAHLPDLVAMHANLVYFILFGVVFLQIGILPFFFSAQ